MEVSNSLPVWRLSTNADSDICGIGDPCLLLQKAFFSVITSFSWRSHETGNAQEQFRAWATCHNGWWWQTHLPCQTNHHFFFFFFFFNLLHLWSCRTNPFNINNNHLNYWANTKQLINLPETTKFCCSSSSTLWREHFPFFIFQWFCERGIWSLKMSVFYLFMNFGFW